MTGEFELLVVLYNDETAGSVSVNLNAGLYAQMDWSQKLTYVILFCYYTVTLFPYQCYQCLYISGISCTLPKYEIPFLFIC